jgi:AcrR family transcriptional regulator
MRTLHVDVPEEACMSDRTRLDPKERKAQILAAALKLAQAEKFAYRTLTKDQIGKEAGCSAGLVHARLGDMAKLPNLLMRLAVKQRLIPIVAGGLLDENRIALKAPDDLKNEAKRWLLKNL